MPTNAQPSFKTRKILFVSLLAFICLVIVYAALQNGKPWVVPEEVKKLKNPLSLSESVFTGAKAIYMAECAQCHGEHGKGDGPDAIMHSSAPADLTDTAHMNGITDGEIFYQISEGRKPMPSFKRRLTEEERWGLVLFVRSFARNSTVAQKKLNPGKDTATSSKH
jgi:mono/diheme cytochrome c family protein